MSFRFFSSLFYQGRFRPRYGCAVLCCRVLTGEAINKHDELIFLMDFSEYHGVRHREGIWLLLFVLEGTEWDCGIDEFMVQRKVWVKASYKQRWRQFQSLSNQFCILKRIQRWHSLQIPKRTAFNNATKTTKKNLFRLRKSNRKSLWAALFFPQLMMLSIFSPSPSFRWLWKHRNITLLAFFFLLLLLSRAFLEFSPRNVTLAGATGINECFLFSYNFKLSLNSDFRTETI